MNVGNFESFLFISYHPDCRNMANHIPRLEPDKNPVWG